ncbi:MAG: NAD(P)-dependent oxidoreductase [Chromatiales bacterium]
MGAAHPRRTTMRIGFIGVGNMGAAMCRNLLEAGHKVAVYARSERSRQRAGALGAALAETPADLAAEAELVITMVTGTADVEALALGPKGIVHGAQPGAVLIDMSTISPEATRRIAATLGEHGVEMLDAPVSGSIERAANGTLTIFIGGEDALLARMRPLLETLGETLFHMGPIGSGQATKLANQICQLANLQGAAEALLFAAEQGVDPARVREAVLTGLGASTMLDSLGRKMVERDFEAGIVAALHHKDLGVAVQLAHRSGLALPVTAQVSQQLNALIGNGWGHLDTSALLMVLERAAGRSKDKG